MSKTYGQLCPLARALDILGDRWTLLVIRELLLGQKRFKLLLETLPAMGTNRLSERLRMLLKNGVVQQVPLPPPASGTVYELTAMGEQLRKPVLTLALWGLDMPLDARIDSATARAELIALCLASAVDPLLISGLQERYEFHVGREVFHVQISKGEVLPRSGPSAEPVDVKINCSLKTFVSLAMGEISSEDARAEGAVHILRGEQDIFDRVFQVLHYRPEPDRWDEANWRF